MTEHEAARKLLVTLHLSVSERDALPDGRVRLSTLVAVLDEALEESQWFPAELRPGHDIGAGALIERREGEIWVHEQHEVGVMRYSPVRSFRVPDAEAAVRAYVEAQGGAPLDGVDVDWDG